MIDKYNRFLLTEDDDEEEAVIPMDWGSDDDEEESVIPMDWGDSSSQNSDEKEDKRWEINVRGAKYTKDGHLGFNLGSFKYEDEKLLNNLHPDIFFVKQGKNNNLWLWVKPNMKDEFLSHLDELKNVLKNTNHYKDKFLDKFFVELSEYSSSAPTQDEIDQSKKIIASNWRELLEKLHDPQVRKKLLAFQTSYTCQIDYRDAVLSKSNISEVLFQDPFASFVTSEYSWKTTFNRTIQDGAPYIIITKAYHKERTDREMNDDGQVRASGGWNKVQTDAKGKRFGRAFASTKRVNRSNKYGKPEYFLEKVYDVRYTIPIDPNNDNFLKIPNLLNNLTGEINDAAKQVLDQEAAAKGVEPVDYDAKTEGITTPEQLEEFKNFILKKCKSKKINISTVGTDEDIITNAIYAYAYEEAESLNKLHHNAKEAFANAVCLTVAVSYGIESSKVDTASNYFQKLSPNEVEMILMDSFETYKELSNYKLINHAALQESVGDGHVMSFDEYKKFLLGKTKNKENIIAQFRDMTSRMNALKR